MIAADEAKHTRTSRGAFRAHFPPVLMSEPRFGSRWPHSSFESSGNSMATSPS